MYNNTNRTINRARTILMSNGIRINWRNIAYVETQDYSEKEGYTFIVRWKYKASILKEEIKLNKPNITMQNYFKQYNLVELYKGCYVNLDRIMLIEEKNIPGPQDRTLVRIVFLDGFEIIKKMPIETWQGWKTRHA